VLIPPDLTALSVLYMLLRFTTGYHAATGVMCRNKQTRRINC